MRHSVTVRAIVLATALLLLSAALGWVPLASASVIAALVGLILVGETAIALTGRIAAGSESRKPRSREALIDTSALITTDFNLNKVAGIRDVVVLNVNDLAHALRPAVLPGETLRVTIVKDGKEPGQGVGYLADGTMIVVEQGRGLSGKTIDVVVTSAIQTTAGKMFFAKLADS